MGTAKPLRRSACAIANSLDVVGDKWSLLVVRYLLHGKRTYGELVNSPERISPLRYLERGLEIRVSVVRFRPWPPFPSGTYVGSRVA